MSDTDALTLRNEDLTGALSERNTDAASRGTQGVTMSYDTKCDELARVFIADYRQPVDEKLVAALAQEIQNVIESFLNANGMPA